MLKRQQGLLHADGRQLHKMPRTRRLCRLQRPHMGLVIHAPSVLRRTRARGHARDNRIKTLLRERRLAPNFWIGRIPPQNRDPRQAVWPRSVGLKILITSARPEQTHHLVTALNQRPCGGHPNRPSRPQQEHAHRSGDRATLHRVMNGQGRMVGGAPFWAQSFVNGHAANSQQDQKLIDFGPGRCASLCLHTSSRKNTKPL